MSELGKVLVYPATLADVDALQKLEGVCFPHDPWSRDSLEGCFTDERYLVALLKLDRTLIGYIIGWHVLDEAEIARIGVLPEYRGQGYGRVLLDSALAEWKAREVNQVFLDVRASNVAARALYAKAGFEEVGLRKGYYHGTEDALLMARGI